MYPRRKDLFTAWAKAMVEGSTVDKPNYSPARMKKSGKISLTRKAKRRRRRKKKAKDA